MRILIVLAFILSAFNGYTQNANIKILLKTKKEKRDWEKFLSPVLAFNRKDNYIEFAVLSDSVLKLDHKYKKNYDIVDSLLSYPVIFKIEAKDSDSLKATTKTSESKISALDNRISLLFKFNGTDINIIIYNTYKYTIRLSMGSDGFYRPNNR